MTHILVVDDSLYQRLLIQKHLKARNHDVLLAKTGIEGLELVAAKNPDLVVLDLVMPEMNGLEMLQRLRDQGSNIPVIINTADIQASTYDKCMQLGAVAILNKPIDGDVLQETIAQALTPPQKE